MACGPFLLRGQCSDCSRTLSSEVYDGPIKLANKSSKTAAEALQSPGLVEYLHEIEAKLALERSTVDAENEGPQ